MERAPRRAFGHADGTPAAVYGRRNVGKEAITRVLAPDPETVVDRVLALVGALLDE